MIFIYNIDHVDICRNILYETDPFIYIAHDYLSIIFFCPTIKLNNIIPSQSNLG